MPISYSIIKVYSLAIMLSRIKMPVANIKRALLAVDDDALSIDDLKAIARHVPSSDEVRNGTPFPGFSSK